MKSEELGPAAVRWYGRLEEWPQIKAPRLAEILRDEYGYTGAYWRSRALLGLAVFDNHQPPRRPG